MITSKCHLNLFQYGDCRQTRSCRAQRNRDRRGDSGRGDPRQGLQHLEVIFCIYSVRSPVNEVYGTVSPPFRGVSPPGLPDGNADKQVVHGPVSLSLVWELYTERRFMH